METKRINKKNIYSVFVVILIIVEAIYLTLSFAYNKRGYHSDELSHYSFANNYSVGSNVFGNEQFEMGEWVDVSSLWNRITVDKEHRFSYVSVYLNTSADANPPLQYFILHTICSLFPGTFSKWYGFAINILSFAIGQMYLYKLVEKLTRGSKVAAISSLVLYGFGVGCFNTVSYLRMYSMATCIALAFAYYSYVLFDNRKFENKKKNKITLLLIFITCFMGAYTLHLFLVFAFGITVCYTLYYLISKRWKLFIFHGISCALAVGLSFALFPTTTAHTFQSTENYTYAQQMYPQKWQFRLLWYIMTKDIFGLHTNAWPKPIGAYALIVFICMLLIIIPVCFIFRKEAWFIKLVDNVKSYCKTTIKKVNNFQYGLIPMAFSVCLLLLVLSYRASVYAMQWFVDRYMFIVYPIFVCFAVSLCYYVLTLVVRKRIICEMLVFVLAIVFALWSNIVSNHVYYFDYPEEGVTFDDLEENANEILLLSAKWQMNSFMIELWDTGNYYLTDFRSFMNEEYNFEGKDNSPLYLLVDQNFVLEDNENLPEWKEDSIMKHEYEILDFFESKDGVDTIKYVGTDWIFEKEIKIYKIEMQK